MNSGRVPARLQEPLMSAVGALEEEAPVCLPPATTTAPTTTSTQGPDEKHHGDDEHGKGKGHGKDHDK